MAYWWVSQNQTFKEERATGILWAPKANSAGQIPHHWQTMMSVQPGDLIFSYVKQTIRAMSVAKGTAVSSARPEEFATGASWEKDGWRIDVDYRDINPPLPLTSMSAELLPLLPKKYSPLTSTGTGVQGYLFGLPPVAGGLLLERLDARELAAQQPSVDAQIEAALRVTVPDRTTREALVASRIGQGAFRESLITYWSGTCAVSGLCLTKLLRASHIKPWRDSNNQERLDTFNGILLSPNYDAAFDANLITFGSDGRILLSPQLTAVDAKALGIDPASQLSRVDPRHITYLKDHRVETLRRRAV